MQVGGVRKARGLKKLIDFETRDGIDAPRVEAIPAMRQELSLSVS